MLIDDSRNAPLEREGDGYFSAELAGVRAGSRYWYLLDDDGPFPDPASRFQPDGPHQASEVIDPDAYDWSDGGWRGVRLPGQVIYEMHVATFTREGSWRAAATELIRLKDLGVTVIELMPVAEFAGRFGWGYDGVDLFAPTHLYGRPDELRSFVDRAHALGMGVILDVVYNHLGPDGNYLHEFADAYFTDRYKCEWGAAINFDGPDARPVREFFISNASYWIREYHLDGLRLDATQQMFDASHHHILADITTAVRTAAGERGTIVVAESEKQDTRLLHAYEDGGFGIDAVWNDDLHHSVRVAATGRREAYFSNHNGAPQEFISAAKYGYLYQGQYYSWQKERRGASAAGIARHRFITYIQNHDQIANSGTGARLHQLTSEGRWRALTALQLLMPGTPMLFQGQEFAASTPFLYFADHKPELAKAVKRGRFGFLEQFPSLASPDVQATLADPADPATFERCKLDAREREQNIAAWQLHSDLIALRKEARLDDEEWRVDGAVIAPSAFVIRYDNEHGEAMLLLVNLGADVRLQSMPEPLLAEPRGRSWTVLFCSESIRYGASAPGNIDISEAWYIPAE
ncbi:MAG TPA: malto-oligosyltrehalose trehalohydrolase, partial [Longimicrobiales bacterium]